MRNPLPFDTHAYVKRLVAAGLPEAQAEVLAELVLSQLVMKDDLRQAIESLELGLVSRLEAELRKRSVWFFGMPVVLAGALVALLRLLPPNR